ncbi:MAG: SDR family oxidoreductase [Kastovskya adunca ATA6-11-RM4]|jgi:short-subunit dehydrogenase|nr:SDR family oxidoreductase [Kastovskya adunca ATA6-11-RM4]
MAQTALITGASQGIGKATALLFARNGYDLVLAARQSDRLEAVASEIRALGRDVIAVSTDVQDAEQVQVLIQKALDYYGSIDVLINNAGIYVLGSVEDFTLSDWHTCIDTNLWGYIHTIYALLPHFLERGAGTIVNVSSIAGKVPISYQIPYTTSKYAVTGLTESLHAELEPKGVQVCGVYPNFIRTSLMERAIFRGKDQQDAQSREDLMKKGLSVPVIEKPDDVAEAIWDAVKHQRAEVVVGAANLSNVSYRLFPGFMQWVFRKTLGTKES